MTVADGASTGQQLMNFIITLDFSGEKTLLSVWGNLLTVAAFAPYLPPSS